MFVFDGSTLPEMEIARGKDSVKRCAATLAEESSISPHACKYIQERPIRKTLG